MLKSIHENDIFKEGKAEGLAQGEAIGLAKGLQLLVQKGLITSEEASAVLEEAKAEK